MVDLPYDGPVVGYCEMLCTLIESASNRRMTVADILRRVQPMVNRIRTKQLVDVSRPFNFDCRASTRYREAP